MPLQYKSRNHHDVVLICTKDHEKYEKLAKFYKTSIAKKYNVDSVEKMNENQIKNVHDKFKDKLKVIKLIETILRRYNEMPDDRILWIAEEILKYTNIDILDISFEELEKYNKKLIQSINLEITEIKTKGAKDLYHGKAVVYNFKNDKDFKKFIRGWRKHFVKSMSPLYMPFGWNIDFSFKRELKEL
jgi:hypothetical protein